MAGIRYSCEYVSTNGNIFKLDIWDKKWNGSTFDFNIGE